MRFSSVAPVNCFKVSPWTNFGKSSRFINIIFCIQLNLFFMLLNNGYKCRLTRSGLINTIKCQEYNVCNEFTKQQYKGVHMCVFYISYRYMRFKQNDHNNEKYNPRRNSILSTNLNERWIRKTTVVQICYKISDMRFPLVRRIGRATGRTVMWNERNVNLFRFRHIKLRWYIITEQILMQ